MAGMTDATPGRSRVPPTAGLLNVAHAACVSALAAVLATFAASVADVDRNYATRSYRGVEAEDVLGLMVLGIVVFACMVWFLRALRFTSAPVLTATALSTAGLLWYWSDPAGYDDGAGTGLVVAVTAGATTMVVAVLASALRRQPVRRHSPHTSPPSVALDDVTDSVRLAVAHTTSLRWTVSAILATAIAIAVTIVAMWEMDHRWWGPVTQAATMGMRERVQPDMVMMMTATACLGIVTAVTLTLAFAIRLPRHPASIIVTAVALAVAWTTLHSAADDRSHGGDMGFCLEGVNGHVHPDDLVSTMCM